MQEGTGVSGGYDAPAKLNGLAMASLILGAAGFVTCGVTGVLGLVFGIIALKQIGKSGARQQGKELAVIGLATGIVSLLITPILAAILFPVFAKAREKAHQASCLSNVKQIALAQLMYAQDNNDRFPPADQWDTLLSQYGVSGKVLSCPSEKKSRLGYAMNAQLGGFESAAVNSPDRVVLDYDSAQGSPNAGGPELLPTPGRHNAGNNIAFADGHAKWIPDGESPSLIWSPR